jgi:hypothetical protein
MSANITAGTPDGVAHEVESLFRAGWMLDMERLGAARYAAGLQAVVELEAQSSPVGAAAAGAR